MNHRSPLLCWDITSLQWNSSNQQTQEFDELYHMAEEHQWEINFYETLYNNFDALIITSMHQHIEWVSNGFEKMTGYSANEVYHRHPSFLQGVNTCQQSLQRIRKTLKKGQQVIADLVNYKKSGEEYLCHIEITPLFAVTNKNKISHFLAVEKEITSNTA